MKAQKRIIQLSFKNTIEEEQLYNWLLSKLSPANYIKEELWNIYNNIPIFCADIEQKQFNDSQSIRNDCAILTPKDEYGENIKRNIEF